MKSNFHPGLVALIQVGILFLPAIPAYIWLWPRVGGTNKDIAQSLSYIYMLAGTLIIGLRRYSWRELAVVSQGWRLSLLCGAALLLGRSLVILAVQWPFVEREVSLLGLAGEVIFYFGLVGLTEELLFRGLIYHALESWRGVRWAIWGSTLLFALYHVPGQGPLAGIGTFLNGLILVAIRWRAGSIAGLILVHGAIDIVGVHMLPSIDISTWGPPVIANRGYLIVGYILLVAVPLYLWRLHPRVGRWLRHA